MSGELTKHGPLHIMHSFGRKCDYCGRMTWPGMPGAAERVTSDRKEWEDADDACAKVTEELRYV